VTNFNPYVNLENNEPFRRYVEASPCSQRHSTV